MKKQGGIQDWFGNQKEAYHFTGKVAESHRVFVVSADTLGKEGAEPWKSTSETRRELEARVDFMERQTGPADVLLYFDGRNMFDCKLFVCNGGWRADSTCASCGAHTSQPLGRRVAWGADSREIGWISLLIPRTALPVKERGEPTSKWGETTHDTVYTGIEPVPWDGLPLISREDKARVMTSVRGVSALTPDEIR